VLSFVRESAEWSAFAKGRGFTFAEGDPAPPRRRRVVSDAPSTEGAEEKDWPSVYASYSKEQLGRHAPSAAPQAAAWLDALCRARVGPRRLLDAGRCVHNTTSRDLQRHHIAPIQFC
jgi:hypothetical protein